MSDVGHILVVSRATLHCANAVHYGIKLARRLGADIHVLHVMENPFKCCHGWNLSAPALALANEYDKILAKTKEELDSVISRERRNGNHIIELIRTGDAAEVIMQAVEEKNIDLIIMSAHKEGRLEQLLFGSSNEKIIRNLPSSILLVKTEPAVLGAEY